MGIIVYIIAGIFIYFPTANIVQGALEVLGTRVGLFKIQYLSFIGSLLFWFAFDTLYKYFSGQHLPIFLVGLVYVLTALHLKTQKLEMNFIFRTNRENEVYALAALFIYLVLFASSTVWL